MQTRELRAVYRKSAGITPDLIPEIYFSLARLFVKAVAFDQTAAIGVAHDLTLVTANTDGFGPVIALATDNWEEVP